MSIAPSPTLSNVIRTLVIALGLGLSVTTAAATASSATYRPCVGARVQIPTWACNTAKYASLRAIDKRFASLYDGNLVSLHGNLFNQVGNQSGCSWRPSKPSRLSVVCPFTLTGPLQSDGTLRHYELRTNTAVDKARQRQLLSFSLVVVNCSKAVLDHGHEKILGAC